MPVVDKVFYLYNRKKFSEKNRIFVNSHPDFIIPPDYMLYEAYRLDYQNYFDDGKNTAHWVIEQFSSFTTPGHKNLLEWGCGPARIIRHIPGLLPGTRVYGTDYNPDTIEWCRQHIPHIEFSVNHINPPLIFPDNKFEMVYAISVFTHLSLQNHYNWINEIYRITAVGGLFLLTTQGEAFMGKLNPVEKKMYSSHQLVERAHVKEGHRSFSAFHPPAFMEKLFSGKWEILRFLPGTINDWGPAQDTWLIRKT